MSKRGRAARSYPSGPGPSSAALAESETTAAAADAAPLALAAVASAPPPTEVRAADCNRFVSFDSLRWRCACGASGRVGRTPDGMPDTSGDVLRHPAGVSKE